MENRLNRKLSTTKTAALEKLLNLPQIEIAMKNTAAESAIIMMSLSEFSVETLAQLDM